MLLRTDCSRREFLRFCAVGAGAALLAACAPKAPAAAPAAPAEAPKQPAAAEPAPADAKKVIVFVGFGTGTSETQIAEEEALIAECNTDLAGKGISAELMITPHEEHLAKFSAMLAAGAPPDIVMPIGIGGVAELYDEDAWLDLQPLIDRDQYDMTDFYGSTITLHTYSKGTLGLPLAIYPSFIYYNKDLFAAAGVDEIPHTWGEAGWDFDKLIEVGRKLTKDSKGNTADKSGFDPADAVQWGYDESWMDFAGMSRGFGATSATGISADYKTSLFDEPAYTQRAQWMSDSIWKHNFVASAEVATEAFSLANDPFSSGMIAMWYCHTWMLGEAYAALTFGWDIGAVPKGPSGALSALVDADTFVMAKAGKQQDAGWEVAKWCCSPGKLERFALTWGSVPARLSGKEIFLTALKEKFPSLDEQVLLTAIDYGDVPNHEAWKPNPAKVGDAIGAAMDQVLLGEERDCAVIMGELDTTVQGYLDEYWKNK